jgi:hypothetical protein
MLSNLIRSSRRQRVIASMPIDGNGVFRKKAAWAGIAEA